MKKYNMVFLLKKMDEDSELEVLDKLLDSINADVFNYVANGTLSFKVNIFGKEDGRIQMKKHIIIRNEIFAYSITLDPMDYVTKPSRFNMKRFKKKVQKLTNRISNEIDCKSVFLEDDLSKLSSSEILFLADYEV